MDAGVSVKHFCLRIKVTKSVMSTVYSQLVPRSTRTKSTRTHGQLVPKLSRTHGQLVPKSAHTHGQVVPKSTRTQVSSYPSYLVLTVNSYPSQLIPTVKSYPSHVVPKVKSYPSTTKCTKYMKECTVELQTVKQPIQRSSQ